MSWKFAIGYHALHYRQNYKLMDNLTKQYKNIFLDQSVDITETQAEEQPNDQVNLPSADTDVVVADYDNQVTIDEVIQQIYSIDVYTDNYLSPFHAYYQIVFC